MKIATIIAVRPQFIKAATISRAIAAQRKIDPVRSFKPPAAHPPLYGDGQAAKKIVHTLTVKGGRP